VYVFSGGKSAVVITLMWGPACMLEFGVAAVSVLLCVDAGIGMYKSQFDSQRTVHRDIFL
jgi:hypothetical protein